MPIRGGAARSLPTRSPPTPAPIHRPPSIAWMCLGMLADQLAKGSVGRCWGSVVECWRLGEPEAVRQQRRRMRRRMMRRRLQRHGLSHPPRAAHPMRAVSFASDASDAFRIQCGLYLNRVRLGLELDLSLAVLRRTWR